METITLDAENFSPNAGASYLWNTGADTRTIDVSAGYYAVTITNVCGSVYASKTIVNYNPNKPDLGPDTIVCKGTFLELSPGSGYSNYLWLVPSNNFPYFNVVGVDSIIIANYDDALPYWGSNSGLLIVNTTNAVGGCQDRDTIQITFKLPPSHSICYVEFDTATQKNNIIWSTPPASALGIKIYREVSTNVWDMIGDVPATQTHFIDTTSNPQNMSYSYKISVLDTCNNEGQKSANHKTITLLSAYDQPTNTYGFTWSAYVGLVVPNYLIYGLNAAGEATQIASVPGNTFFYNYTNPLPSYVKYFVAFISPSCNNKTDYLVKSNLVNSIPLAINELQTHKINVFPNPVSNMLHIEAAYEYAEFFDASGRYTTRFDNKQCIDVSNWTKGLYFIRLITKTNVLSGKIIVE
ncbi:MAG: hypothetical protein BWY70_00053 [Bacteroidetes bacterium ADurb.Bin408]|nr:MAG: hypothetical protein BWY70_00053 [Bacteroidetes bacterium ADurb.Bin408]